MAGSILNIFNNHLLEFVEDVERVFPEDVDLRTAKNTLLTVKKANPRLIPNVWYKYVAGPYREVIQRGDCDFFIDKDYSQDLSRHSHADKILEVINRLKSPVRNMTREDQLNVMKYVQNLSQLCYDYSDQLLTTQPSIPIATAN